MLKYFYELLVNIGETVTLKFQLNKTYGEFKNYNTSNLTSTSDSSYNYYTIKIPTMFSHYVPNSIESSTYPYVYNKTENATNSYFFDYWTLSGNKSLDGCFVNNAYNTYSSGSTYTFLAIFYRGIKITLDANTGKFNLSNSSTCITIGGKSIYNEQGLINNECAQKGYLWSPSTGKIIICYKATESKNIVITREAVTHINTTYKLAGWSTIKNNNSGRKRTWAFNNSSSSTTLYATWGVETTKLIDCGGTAVASDGGNSYTLVTADVNNNQIRSNIKVYVTYNLSDESSGWGRKYGLVTKINKMKFDIYMSDDDDDIKYLIAGDKKYYLIGDTVAGHDNDITDYYSGNINYQSDGHNDNNVIERTSITFDSGTFNVWNQKKDTLTLATIYWDEQVLKIVGYGDWYKDGHIWKRDPIYGPVTVIRSHSCAGKKENHRPIIYSADIYLTYYCTITYLKVITPQS